MATARLPNDELVGHILAAASHLANQSKGALTLEKLLAGLYIAGADHLQMYVDNGSALTRFVIVKCGIKMPAWFYLLRIHETLRAGQGLGVQRVAPEVTEVLENASSWASKIHRSRVTLTDLLLAIEASEQFMLCREFIAAGIACQRIRDDYVRSG